MNIIIVLKFLFFLLVIYIKMDDMAYGIEYPAVIDFKIGRQTYDPEATTEKIIRQKLKYPPVEKIGFQLLGMRASLIFLNIIAKEKFYKFLYIF